MAQDDLGHGDVVGVHVCDELAAMSTRWDDKDCTVLVLPDGDDGVHQIRLTRANHRGDRNTFSADGVRIRADTHARVHVPLCADHCSADIRDHTGFGLLGRNHPCSNGDELLGGVFVRARGCHSMPSFR